MYFTCPPSSSIFALVSVSSGVLATIQRSPFASLMAVDLPPTGIEIDIGPRRANGLKSCKRHSKDSLGNNSIPRKRPNILGYLTDYCFGHFFDFTATKESRSEGEGESSECINRQECTGGDS